MALTLDTPSLFVEFHDRVCCAPLPVVGDIDEDPRELGTLGERVAAKGTNVSPRCIADRLTEKINGPYRWSAVRRVAVSSTRTPVDCIHSFSTQLHEPR